MYARPEVGLAAAEPGTAPMRSFREAMTVEQLVGTVAFVRSISGPSGGS